jgi:predicted secreted hydrolase
VELVGAGLGAAAPADGGGGEPMTRVRLGVLVLGVLAAACARPVAPLPPAPAPTPTVVPPISYPADAGAHDVLTEWWYVTGHLRAQGEPHEYGFEFTIFQVRRAGAPVGYLSHFAVSDVDGQTFSHAARFTSGAPQSGFDLDVDGWRLTSDGTDDAIRADMAPGPGAEVAYGLDLRLHALKPPALHNGGYIDEGPPGGSYYYSRTRLAVTGELRTGQAAPTPVAGQAWMDHQWGNFVVAGGGWDWYALQLDDGRELMLYVLRDTAGQTTGVYGSEVEADGSVRALAPDAVTASATGAWTSPHTGTTYPSGWRVRLPQEQLDLVITPKLVDQELYFPGQGGGPVYWEGDVAIADQSGTPRGEGYVELTGYAPR